MGGLGDPDDPCVVIGQRYELRDRIAHGSTATVYRAFDRVLDREVALKLLHPGELEAAEREARILAQVRHRNVVTLHDSGFAAGVESRRFLVLELLTGRDLRAWLRERPSTTERLERFAAAGRGLHAVHQRGFVHRDFKPSNVIIDDHGRVILIDFGLASAVDRTTPANPRAFVEGTLAYMAPERLAGHAGDARSDQFSFCVALWEALAGASPFAGRDPLERYRAIAEGPAHGDRVLASGAGRGLLAALTRGLGFDPRARFPSLAELLGLLEARPPTRAWLGDRAGRDRGRPIVRAHEVGARPTLMAIGVAATLMLGWGLAPEGLTVEPAFSSLDPTADAALTILESAHRHAEAGRVEVALNDLMVAAQLIEGVEKGGESFCAFAHAMPRLAGVFEQQRAGNQAQLVYAIGIRFAQYCPTLDAGELRLRQEAARAMTWTDQHEPGQCLVVNECAKH